MTVHLQTNGAADPQKNGSVSLSKYLPAYSDKISGPGGYGIISNANGVPTMEPRYPHIKDLQAKADQVIKELSVFIPVC